MMNFSAYKFSVVIPVYNRENVLGQAIKSVINQTFDNFELIIVDDCSTDNSVRIVKEFNDKRIKIYQLDKNYGAAMARNYGVGKAQGEYISFLDSDDYFENDFLEKTINKVDNSREGVGFWYTGLIYHENKKNIFFYWDVKRYKTPYLTFLHDLKIGSGAGITIKKKIFEEINGFNVNLPAAEDTDFFLRLSKISDFEGVEYHLVNVVKTGNDRLSKNYIKIALSYNIFIKEHLMTISKHTKLKIKFYYKLMWLNFHLENKEIANYWFKLLKNEGLVTSKIKFTFLIYNYLPLRFSSIIHNQISRFKI